jgi:hypothetical protein
VCRTARLRVAPSVQRFLSKIFSKPLRDAATEAILLYDSFFGIICASAHLGDKVTSHTNLSVQQHCNLMRSMQLTELQDTFVYCSYAGSRNLKNKHCIEDNVGSTQLHGAGLRLC